MGTLGIKIIPQFLVWNLELNTSDQVKFYLSAILLEDENVHVIVVNINILKSIFFSGIFWTVYRTTYPFDIVGL